MRLPALFFFFMDHIFGDSDDISFGSGAVRSSFTPSAPVSSSHEVRTPRTPTPRSVPRANVPSPRPTRESSSLPSRSSVPAEPAIIDNTPALSRLIAGMKSSFLPREEDMTSVRIVALSAYDSIDPLFMIRCDDTTILMGSGFGSITRAGHVYPTFPNMVFF